MKVVRVLGVSIAIGCSILLVNAGGAVGETSVDAQGVTPSGFQVRTDGSWTYYDRKLPSDFDVVIEKGAFDREGQCFFSSSREMRGEEGLIEGVEIAYSAKTCERRVAERKITSETASLIEDEHRREVGEPQIDTGGSVSSTEPARSGMVATASRRIQTISWFEDPPGLDVTWTRARTSWNYNGSCVTSHSPSAADNWLTTTGWTRIGNAWSHPLYCSYSKSSVYRNFRNGKFCATIDTYNKYNNTEVIGKANGSSSYLWNNQKSGGCTSLLSHRYVYGTY